MKMTKKAVLYARVSGDDRKNEGRNLESQLEMCHTYAINKGWIIVAELAEDDRGAGGASYDLPQLNRALELARTGSYDFLVVREIDRLSRDIGKQYMIEGELNRNGVKVVYVLSEYPDTPEGHLNKAIKAAIASYERTKITERMVRGRRREAKRGSIIGHGKAPYGYDLVHDGNKYILVINEQQAAVVRLIYKWYTQGEGGNGPISMRAICHRLAEKGYLTPSGKAVKWPRPTVSRIISSETYAGVWHYGKYAKEPGHRINNPVESWIPVEVPAIVDREVWELAQERRTKNKIMARRNLKYSHLLSKQVTCGDCGCKMSASAGGGKANYRYYRCMAGHGYQDYQRECNNRSYYRGDYVDAIAWEWIKSIFLNPEELEEGYQLYQDQREAQNEPLQQQLALANDLLAENQEKLDRLLDLYLSGDIEKDLLVDRKLRLENVVSALQMERDNLLARMEAGKITQEQIKSIQVFAEALAERVADVDSTDNFERKRQIIELLDVQAELNFEGEERVVVLSCALGREAMFIVSPNTCRHCTPENHNQWLGHLLNRAVCNGPHQHRPALRPYGPGKRPYSNPSYCPPHWKRPLSPADASFH
jgi:site-specific DNA recombinase